MLRSLRGMADEMPTWPFAVKTRLKGLTAAAIPTAAFLLSVVRFFVDGG